MSSATGSLDPAANAVVNATVFGTPIGLKDGSGRSVIVLLDYPAASGRECRSYRFTDDDQLRGLHLVCRGADGWQMVKPLLAASDPAPVTNEP